MPSVWVENAGQVSRFGYKCQSCELQAEQTLALSGLEANWRHAVV